MSGGWAVKTKKRGVVRAGAERAGDYTARVFCPQGLALTAWGPQAPNFKKQSQPQAVIDQTMGVSAEGQRRPFADRQTR